MEPSPLKRLARVKQIPDLYPGVFTEASIRWLIFNETVNGFSDCLRRIGKNVLIDIDSFEKWIEEQKKKPGLTPLHFECIKNQRKK